MEKPFRPSTEFYLAIYLFIYYYYYLFCLPFTDLKKNVGGNTVFFC